MGGILNPSLDSIRLVPRVDKDVNADPMSPVPISLRTIRSRLDFTTRDKVGIRYTDMLAVARDILERKDIKDLGDMNAEECRIVLEHLLTNTNRVREKYPFWGK